MKKLLVLMMLFLLIGCAGLQPKPIITAGTDTAFVLVLQNNPSYKPAIVAGLNEIKAVLSGSLTYDDLLIQITKSLPGPYAVVATIFIGELSADMPISTTAIPMLDSYKTGVSNYIDHLILLTGLIK
jgi:hypothetical protein